MDILGSKYTGFAVPEKNRFVPGPYDPMQMNCAYTFSSCARLQLTKFFSSKSGLSFSEFGHSHEELKTCGMIRTFCGNPIDFVDPNFETHYLASMAFGDGKKLKSYDIWEVCHGIFELPPGLLSSRLFSLQVAKQLQALAWLLAYQRKQAEEFLGGHQFGMRKSIENKNTGQWIGEIQNVYVQNVHIYCNGGSSKLVLEWRVLHLFEFLSRVSHFSTLRDSEFWRSSTVQFGMIVYLNEYLDMWHNSW